MRPDIEHFESEVPFRVMRYEFMTDAEGAGEYRGGPGHLRGDGLRRQAGPSVLPHDRQLRRRGRRRAMARLVRNWPGWRCGWRAPTAAAARCARCPTNRCFAGEVVLAKAPGGGGWGDPLDRDPRKVWADVVDGLITRRRAREVYGVVLGPEGRPADELGTRRGGDDGVAGGA